MAEIDRIQLHGADLNTIAVGSPADIWRWAKERIAAFVWVWFEQHKNDTLFTIRILVFSYKVKVRRTRGLFETLFGPRPT